MVIQVPLYVATKMSPVKGESPFIPSPEQYASAAVRNIGYEARRAPSSRRRRKAPSGLSSRWGKESIVGTELEAEEGAIGPELEAEEEGAVGTELEVEEGTNRPELEAEEEGAVAAWMRQP
ncbi:hypothetical protein PR202_ga21912 [Eleusine coracana subsp. coracana]|uniref:Uncharacterized protein n=1 Tax=Eleusine coracana subsp. coracana TaxID=191504 RepID=A0AAV5D205_ELECO|nr:hypothetical protein PR202_ga21912 [Eleusine coracana subsp. coracana]